MADLLINGKDAYTTWGIRMGSGFIDVLAAPSPLKEFVSNKSRLEDGKRVVVNAPKQEERDIALTFTIEGSTKIDYNSKKKAFISELYKGKVSIQIPENGDEVYHLIYTGKNVTYSQNISQTFGKITCKFNEPNPADR